MPFIAGGNLGDFRVEENMVLNIDMELHEIGWGGMFFEESMRVTATGSETPLHPRTRPDPRMTGVGSRLASNL